MFRNVQRLFRIAVVEKSVLVSEQGFSERLPLLPVADVFAVIESQSLERVSNDTTVIAVCAAPVR